MSNEICYNIYMNSTMEYKMNLYNFVQINLKCSCVYLKNKYKYVKIKIKNKQIFM